MKESNLTLEEKIAKIERETAWFEGDDFVLEKAIEKYKEIIALVAEVEKELTELENTIIDLENN
ncbi:exodeoxyribonuclease VII small subunit [Candidatus Saccharibacteria bacterium]|nr:exodeoxyribonuclease VII small subunit [Candidatus Saccharibacteria bacterium]